MTIPALQVEGLTRTFGSRAAIQNLNLVVNEGDVYGFLGPNGAGKTTAIRCILGLIRSDRGTVQIFGDARRPRALRPVGAIVETPAFHDWLDGRDNLRLAAAYADLSAADSTAEIERVLDRVGLTDRANDAVKTYSLGMRQRLGIARALLGRPRLLLLDEPTNGLDPRGMHEVRELVRSLALHDRITVFISSHLLAEIEAICNRVGIIQQGTLRAEGEVSALLAAHAKGRHIVEVGSPDADALRTVLDGLEGAVLIGAGATGRFRVALTELDVAGLNRALVEQGVAVQALVPESGRLEDVFLEVTR